MTNENFKNFTDKGFLVSAVHSPSEVKMLYYFAVTWIRRLLIEYVPPDEEKYPLSKYHVWQKLLPPEHRNAFNAKNRYQYPPTDVMASLVNENMLYILNLLGIEHYNIWDDGWGNVGFRLIRPGANDGYPLCAKEWGVAKGVISFWIPIIGLSSQETLLIVPGSNRRDYEREIASGKFAAGEPRFAGDESSLIKVRPKLNPGEIICYDSRTLHSEDVQNSSITRLNLEIRFQPKNNT